METLFALALIALIGWFWLDNMRAREIASSISKAACRKMQLQLLDDTVALTRMSLHRDANRSLSIRRSYRFEYSDASLQRRAGRVTLRGIQLEDLCFDDDAIDSTRAE